MNAVEILYADAVESGIIKKYEDPHTRTEYKDTVAAFADAYGLPEGAVRALDEIVTDYVYEAQKAAYKAGFKAGIGLMKD